MRPKEWERVVKPGSTGSEILFRLVFLSEAAQVDVRKAGTHLGPLIAFYCILWYQRFHYQQSVLGAYDIFSVLRALNTERK